MREGHTTMKQKCLQNTALTRCIYLSTHLHASHALDHPGIASLGYKDVGAFPPHLLSFSQCSSLNLLAQHILFINLFLPSINYNFLLSKILQHLSCREFIHKTSQKCKNFRNEILGEKGEIKTKNLEVEKTN